MLVSHFPDGLFVGLITAVNKSGNNLDMSYNKGSKVGFVSATLCVILQQRLATWAKQMVLVQEGMCR